ncbi:MAG TPA: hypothetical protein PKA39_00450, partial [Ignavibacteria bacterium]|nr:hypothetical protein [Ignavibacteria bacterium]
EHFTAKVAKPQKGRIKIKIQTRITQIARIENQKQNQNISPQRSQSRKKEESKSKSKHELHKLLELKIKSKIRTFHRKGRKAAKRKNQNQKPNSNFTNCTN